VIEKKEKNYIYYLSSGRASLFYCPMLFYSSIIHIWNHLIIHKIRNGGRIHLYKSEDFYHIVKKKYSYMYIQWYQYVVKYFKFLSTFRSYIEQKENLQHQFNIISECGRKILIAHRQPFISSISIPKTN
jgi:hypothetical protein